jgi:hypothetical protein
MHSEMLSIEKGVLVFIWCDSFSALLKELAVSGIILDLVKGNLTMRGYTTIMEKET